MMLLKINASVVRCLYITDEIPLATFLLLKLANYLLTITFVCKIKYVLDAQYNVKFNSTLFLTFYITHLEIF